MELTPSDEEEQHVFALSVLVVQHKNFVEIDSLKMNPTLNDLV
jgi:hypothetical protein